MKKIIVSWIVPLACTFGLMLVFFPVMNKYSQSFKFVDEAEHMVMAWLLDKGYHLYRDFPNNHQPISYFASWAVQHLSHIDNVFMLGKRHRQAIFLWSALWWLFLIKRFGKKAVVPIFLFENIKYFTLGNEFLAESLIVYPLGYLFGSLTQISTKKVSRPENYLVGLLTGFIQLTLLPMAVVLGGMTIIRYVKTKGKGLKYFVGGILTVAAAVFLIVDPRNYTVEVINGLRYSLPGLSPINKPLDFIKLIGLPVLYFPFYKDIIGQTVILTVFWWVTAVLIYVFLHRRKELIFTLILMFFWLITNTRVNHANEYFYQAFHLTPWLFMGLMGGLIVLWQAVVFLSKKWRLMIFMVSAIGFIVIVTHNNLPLYTKIDPETEHYIQYTPLAEAAGIINSLKKPGDTLMVIPNETWLYYMTEVTPAPTNMITYYEWQVLVPHNGYQFYKTLNETPPTFIMYRDDASFYSPMMNEYLKHNYIELRQYPHVYINDKFRDRVRDETTL
jgi:hypothetical protein